MRVFISIFKESIVIHPVETLHDVLEPRDVKVSKHKESMLVRLRPPVQSNWRAIFFICIQT